MLQLIALLCLITPVQAPAQPQPPDEAFARALKLHQSGNLQEALKAYQEFLKVHSESVEARSNLGAVYARLGDYGRAIEQYKHALEAGKRNPGVLFNLGVAHYQSAQIREAATAFSAVLSIQPDNRNAALLLADCHLRMGENKKVIDLLDPLQAAHKGDRALLYLLGTALIRDNQVEKGQRLVDEILRNGDSAETRFMLATAQMMARDYKGAAEEFARTVKLNPNLPSAHAYYGRVLLATGDRSGATENFQRELQLNPNDFDSNLFMGVLLKQDRRFDEALRHLERALKIRPGDPSVRYQIGSAYLTLDNLAEAQRILEGLTKESPDFAEAHVSLATVYYRLKRKEDGDRHREIVRKLNEQSQGRAPAGTEIDLPYRGEASSRADAAEGARESFENVSSRASAAREANRTAEAIGFYKRAVESRPSWHEGWWYLGTLHYEEDRYNEAREAFSRLVSLQPEGGVAWGMLGLCEFQLGDYDRAYHCLQKSRALGIPSQTQLSIVSRYHLAILLNRMGKPEAALQILYLLAGKERDGPSIVAAMGLSALALPYLPSEIPSDKRDLVTKAGQAQYSMATRRMAEARKASEELIAQFPHTPNVHYSFGIFLLVENPDAALDEFRRELEISPRHVPARLQIAFEYIKRSDYEKGLPYAEEAVVLAPDSFPGRNALGRILLELGKTERAIEELEAGLKLARDSPEMHFALARAYTRAGRPEEAARAREEFKRLDRMRRTSKEGPQAVGGLEPPPDKPPK